MSLRSRAISQSTNDHHIKEPSKEQIENSQKRGPDSHLFSWMIKGKNTNPQENENHSLSCVSDGLIRNHQHFSRSSGDIRCCIDIEEDAVNKDGYDTRELKAVSYEVGYPRTHDHH